MITYHKVSECNATSMLDVRLKTEHMSTKYSSAFASETVKSAKGLDKRAAFVFPSLTHIGALMTLYLQPPPQNHDFGVSAPNVTET